MRTKYISLFLAIVLVVCLLLPLIPVQAAVYIVDIGVTNSGASATALPVIVPYNVSSLVGLWSTTIGTCQILEGVSLRSGLVDWGATDKIVVFVDGGLAALQSRAYQFKVGTSTGYSYLPIMTGVGGFVTTAYAANLDLGTTADYKLELSIDYQKLTGASARVFLTGPDGLTFEVTNDTGLFEYNCGGVTLTSVTPADTGVHILIVETYGVGLVRLLVDGVVEDSDVIVSAIGPNDDFVLGESTAQSVPYFNYWKITTSGVLRLWQQCNAVTADGVPDQSGNGNSGVITWGANPVGITVTAGPVGAVVTPTVTPGPAVVAKTPTIAGYYETTGEDSALPWYELFSSAATGRQVYTTGTATGAVGTKTLTAGGGGSWPLGDSWKGYSILLNGDANYYVIDYVNAGGQIILTTDLLTSPVGATYRVGTAALGWSSNQLYGVMVLFAGSAIGVAVAIATGSLLLAGVAVGVGLAMGAGQGVLGWWIVIIYGIIASAYIMVSKSS